MVQDQPLVDMIGITKRFGDVVANRDVDLQVKQGEVLGLLGENGAGKTTLMNILFGMYRPDGGTIRIGGKPVMIRNPADAIALGIGMVHQHAQVVERHTVAENLLVGLPGKGLELDLGRVTARLAEIGRDYGLELAPNRLVGELGVGEKQRLDIVKALFRGARVLILDEPTSVLTPDQAQGLFKAIRALTAGGVSVIFISHKLNEVRAITDRVVIMRRGAVVARLPNDALLTNIRMAELMCGHDLKPVTGRGSPPGRPMLEARGIVPRRLALAQTGRTGIDLTIAAGEIVGLAGVSGNGQVELAEAMAGVEPAALGSIAIAGRTQIGKRSC